MPNHAFQQRVALNIKHTKFLRCGAPTLAVSCVAARSSTKFSRPQVYVDRGFGVDNVVPHGVAGTWPRLGFRAGDRTSTGGALKEKQKVHRFKRQKFARLLRWSLIASATHSPIHVTGSPPFSSALSPSATNSHNCAACLLR